MPLTKALNAFTDKSSNLTIIGCYFFCDHRTYAHLNRNVLIVFGVSKKLEQVLLVLCVIGHNSLGPIILGSAFVLSSTVASMNILSNNFAGYQLDGSFPLWLISFLLTIVGFFILYWTIPNRSVPILSMLLLHVLGNSI